ncbi:MAG TPA: hypothetical protein ENN29_06295 [Candidatus Hydrogenedentes bacterium]|nr:hypothetical protein [Candidatus Hydrogenedentota bacterium]
MSNPVITFFSALLTPKPATEGEGEPVSFGLLAGVVLNAHTLLPIEGAVIALTPGDFQETSNATGTFLFLEVPAGEYTANVSADGYEDAHIATQIEALTPATVNILLTPTPDPEEGEPGQTGAVAGFVLDAATLAPVPYAQVSLTPGDKVTETNIFGAFVFTEVAFGNYVLGVNADGYEDGDRNVTVESVAGATATVLLEKEGEPPTGSIAGIITRADFTSLPIAGATVTLMPNDISATTNALGAYAFPDLAYGEYTVHAGAEGYESSSENITVDEPGLISVNISLVPLEGEATGAIGGFVYDAWTRLPVEDAAVALAPGERVGQTSMLGAFLFDNLPYGEYNVEVSKEGYVTATESAEVDGTAASILEIELTPSEGEPTGAIRGVVLDAATNVPIEGVSLKVAPGDYEAQTNGLGAYSFTGLVYGEYTLEAHAAGYDPEIRNVTVANANAIQNFALTPVETVDEGESEGEGEGEDESEGETEEETGCCRCRDSEKSVDWMFILKEYWLFAAVMIGVGVWSKRR